jgi:hypothetical protein
VEFRVRDVLCVREDRTSGNRFELHFTVMVLMFCASNKDGAMWGRSKLDSHSCSWVDDWSVICWYVGLLAVDSKTPRYALHPL